MSEDRICIKCNEIINPLRIKALPQTLTCVNCSTIGAKKGVSMMFGEKDHTWTDMVIVDPDRFKIIEDQKSYLEDPEKQSRIEEGNEVEGEKIDIDDEDDDFSDWDNTLLDGLEDL
jgi:hypothetical protein